MLFQNGVSLLRPYFKKIIQIKRQRESLRRKDDKEQRDLTKEKAKTNPLS
jgi:hypothetical protein